MVNMNLNETKYGFTLINVRDVLDINSKLYEFKHNKSGGTVAYLENSDTNCAFAIGFRTKPVDSTGVCHIIEHSVLCGSKKFPLKEPFVNLLKGSLSTFLNAFTAYDWTMYPFASQTPKDFNNILDIYCDAVFNPLSVIDNKPFLQEGWHYELNNKEDELTYKGVVYNEMKGAMSSSDEVLVETMNQAMYPDTCYRHNSGGDPKNIIDLTYEDYKAFYKKHYNPQNAMTYFYGDMDILEKLEFLDREYFSKYDYSEDCVITINKQKDVINKELEESFVIGADEDETNNYHVGLSYALNDYEDNETFLAFQILVDALLSKNDSPLKKALLDSKLGEDIDARIDDDNIVPSLQIMLKKTTKGKKNKFFEVFTNEVKKLVEEGIDKNLLLASINHSEFKDKELDTGRFAKGLVFAMTMMGSFNYKGDLMTHLEFSKYYDLFRKELNNNYFENLLKKYILDSTHYALVSINPDSKLGALREEELKKKLSDIKSKMSDKELDDLVKQTKDLIAYQNHVDTKKELATLPKLKIKDIPNTINYVDSKKIKVKGINGIKHVMNTNKIAYIRMFFSLNTINSEDLIYVNILKNVLLNSDTSKYSVSELNNIIKTYLGDFSFNENVFGNNKDEVKAYLKLSLSGLDSNVCYISDVVNEVLNKTKFNKKATLTILKQMYNSLKEDLIGNGMYNSMAMVNASYSKASALNQLAFDGIIVYNKLGELINNYDFASIKDKLKEVSLKLFNKKNTFISISGDEETILKASEELKNVKLSNKKFEEVLNINTFDKGLNKALVIPSQVNYNACGSNLSEFGLTYKGSYNVLSHIGLYDYLWSEVRVKGGAYGSRLTITKSGNVTFGSYRDPNVSNTYDVYAKFSEYLKNFKVSKEEFNTYIIGAMGNFDMPGSNSSLINEWDINYLLGITKKDKMNLKKEVLNTKQEDIVACAELFEKMINNSTKYTIGSDTKIKEYKFDEVDNL